MDSVGMALEVEAADQDRLNIVLLLISLYQLVMYAIDVDKQVSQSAVLPS
jgi:hypothetical protein